MPEYGYAHLQVGLDTLSEVQGVGVQLSTGVEYVGLLDC